MTKAWAMTVTATTVMVTVMAITCLAAITSVLASLSRL